MEQARAWLAAHGYRWAVAVLCMAVLVAPWLADATAVLAAVPSQIGLIEIVPSGTSAAYPGPSNAPAAPVIAVRPQPGIAAMPTPTRYLPPRKPQPPERSLPPIVTTGRADPQRGGQLSTHDGRVRLSIPSGGLADDLDLTMRQRFDRRVAPDNAIVHFELEAHRLADGSRVDRFARPLTLTAHYEIGELDGADPATLRFAYYDERGRTWQGVPTKVDTASQTATAQIDHFSTWYLAPGPLQVEVLPRSNVEDATLDLFEGAATVRFPLEVPPGTAGLTPSLVLSYHSLGSYLNQRADFMSRRTGKQGYQTASEYGEGFDIEVGQIDVQQLPGFTTVQHLSLFGRRLGLYLKATKEAAGTSYDEYRTNEDLVYRVRFWPSDNHWDVTAPDGTLYAFGVSGNARRVHVEVPPGAAARQVTDRWMLSSIQDVHGMQVNFTYDSVAGSIPNQCGAQGLTYTTAIYLKTISYAGGQRVLTLDRTGSSQRADAARFGTFPTNPCTQNFYKLQNIQDIYIGPPSSSSNFGTATHRYHFSYDTTGPTTLMTKVERVAPLDPGKRQTLLTPRYTTFTDRTCACSNPNDTYTLLAGFGTQLGGDVAFDYEALEVPWDQAHDYRDLWGDNGELYPIGIRRLLARRTSPGTAAPGYAMVESYAYQGAMGMSGPENPSFRGHAQVDVTTANRTVQHFFLQGVNGPTFQMMWRGLAVRDGWPLHGREWRTIVKATDGSILQVDERRYEALPSPGMAPGSAYQVRMTDQARFAYPAGATSIQGYVGPTLGTHWGNFDGYGHAKTAVDYLDGNRYRKRWRQQTSFNTVQWIVDLPGVVATYRPGTPPAPRPDNPDSPDIPNPNDTPLEATWYVYDTNHAPNDGQGSRGDLTLVRRQLDFRSAGTTYAAQTVDTEYSYDAYGNRLASRVHSATGYVWEVLGGAQGGTTPGAGSPASTTSVTYDPTAAVIRSLTHPETSHGRDDFNEDSRFPDRPGTHVDPNGWITNYAYDDFGRLVNLWLPTESKDLGHQPSVVYQYRDDLRPAQVVELRRVDLGGSNQNNNPAWRAVYRYYDGLGRLVQQKEQIDGGWAERSYRYDDSGRLSVETHAALAGGPEYRWPDWGLLQTFDYRYDGLDRLTQVSTPDRAITIHSHDGRVTTIRDPDQGCKQIQRDALGRVVVAGDFTAWGCQSTVSTGFTYDELDRLTTISAPESVWRFTYDPLGRLTDAQDPNRGSWHYGYDARGNLRRRVDGAGNVVLQRFDDEGRLTGRAVATPAPFSASTLQGLRNEIDRVRTETCGSPCPYGGWDTALAAGRMVQAPHVQQLRDALRGLPGSSTSLRFTAGEPSSTQLLSGSHLTDVRRWLYGDEIAGVAFTPTESFSYDTFPSKGRGHLTGMATTSGFAASFSYDARGRLITDSRAIDGATYDTAFEYSAADRIVKVTYPKWNPINSGETPEIVQYGYDAGLRVGRVPGYAPTVHHSIDGLLEQVDDDESSVTRTWTHDAATRRVTGVGYVNTAGGDRAPHLAFDYGAGHGSDGDVPYVAVNNVRTYFQYDALHRLTGGDGLFAAQYAWDDQGSLAGLTEGTRTTNFRLDAAFPRHAPKAAAGVARTYDRNGNLLGDGTRRFTYDGFNRLLSGSRVTAGSPTVTYAYAPDGTVYKRTVDGQATVYVGDLYERDTATGAVRTTYWVDGLPIAQQDAGGKTWLYTDRTGSVVATRRVNTAATDTVRYTPFGADRDATGQLATDRRFAGMRWEPALGLYRAGPRLYDPGVGQFLQPDPVTLADPFDMQLRNPYAYARGNPLRYADGSGMVPVPIGNGPRDVGGALLSAYDAQVQPSGQHACVPVAICNANAVLSDEAIAAVLQTYQARLGNGLVVRTDGIILAAAEGASEESEGGGGGGGGAPPPGDRGEAAGNAIKGLTGGRLARYLGMRGEAAIGLPRTKREAVRMPGFAPAIPDALDHRMKTITEVKNVSGKLGLSPQLKLFMEYARARGYTFELYVRAETRLTTTLRAAIESGDIVLRFLP